MVCAITDILMGLVDKSLSYKCKHVLAARLADELKLFIERPMSADDVQAMMLEQYSNVDYDTPMALV